MVDMDGIQLDMDTPQLSRYQRHTSGAIFW